MDSLVVDPAGDFLEKGRFPCRSLGRRGAVGHLVAADYDDLRPWPLCHDVRERTHENVITSQRLEIAGRKSYDLVRASKLPARRKAKHRVGTGLGDINVDALVAHRDFALVMIGKSRALPGGWLNAR